MVNFSARAPVQPEKPHYLHNQAEKPKAPRPTLRTVVRQNADLALGVLVGIGFVALAFQIRAGWENHREWVVATTVPFTATAGVALGALLGRQKWEAALAPILFVLLAIMLVIFNILRGYETEGPDGLRDAMSIISGICLGAACLSAIAAFIWVEVREPYRAPAPEGM